MYEFLGKMAKIYPLMIIMGLAIVIVTFIIGASNSQIAAEYFSADKITRETTMMAERQAIEAIGIWMPALKFFGLGMILGGIVMALRVIIDHLRDVGKTVLPTQLHDKLPQPPWYGLLMPYLMMMGMLPFIIALVVSIPTAVVANDVFANPLPVIDGADPAVAGELEDELVAQVQFIHTTEAWLVPLKFTGVASQLLAIVMGLTTIVYILNQQSSILDKSLAAFKSTYQSRGAAASRARR